MFKKGILALSIVALVVFAAGLAFAADIDGLTDVGDLGGYNVYVNPGNQGDALLYGYYNVRRNGNLFTIVNTSDTVGVVARIRFREAKESTEVLDFNICLSADDMFVGIIVDDGTQGRIIQLDSDTTLTRPTIPSTGFAFKHAGNGSPFTNVTADMTKEGYFEVFALTTLPAEPTSCPDQTQSSDPDAPNVLGGSFFMMDDTGKIFGYRALALADFANSGLQALGFSSAKPQFSNTPGGIEAVNWALTKRKVEAEYALSIPSEGVTGETAYVITFPTKHELGSKWEASCTTTSGAVVDIDIFDENENSITTPEQPSPISTVLETICYEVNVIEMANATTASDIVDSGVEVSLDADTFNLGWVRVDLYNGIGVHSTVNAQANAWTLGLPAWAWWLQTVDDVEGHGVEPMYETDVTNVNPNPNP